MRTILTWIGVLSVAILCGFIGSVSIRKLQAQVAGIYPAYTVQYSGVSRGTHGSSSNYTYTWSLKSNGDGAMSTPIIRQIALRARGIFVSITPSGQYKMTNGDGKPTKEIMLDCSKLAGITGESKQILGVKALHVVETDSQTAADGSILTQTDDSWVAPACNCRPLYSHLSWTYNGKPNGDKEESATSVTLGDPDEALYTVPPTAQEAAPDVFYQSIGQKASPQQTIRYNADQKSRATLGQP